MILHEEKHIDDIDQIDFELCYYYFLCIQHCWCKWESQLIPLCALHYGARMEDYMATNRAAGNFKHRRFINIIYIQIITLIIDNAHSITSQGSQSTGIWIAKTLCIAMHIICIITCIFSILSKWLHYCKVFSCLNVHLAVRKMLKCAFCRIGPVVGHIYWSSADIGKSKYSWTPLLDFYENELTMN